MQSVAEGTRVVVTLQEESGLAMLRMAIRPLLLAWHERSVRAALYNDVKRLIVACSCYARDHKDEWPKELQKLVSGKYVSCSTRPTARGPRTASLSASWTGTPSSSATRQPSRNCWPPAGSSLALFVLDLAIERCKLEAPQ